LAGKLFPLAIFQIVKITFIADGVGADVHQRLEAKQPLVFINAQQSLLFRLNRRFQISPPVGGGDEPANREDRQQDSDKYKSR